MTFKKAVELWERASETKPSGFLFDGQENRNAEMDAVHKAFGIVEVNSLCDSCEHQFDECPFAEDYGEVYEKCNFFKEAE